MRFGMNVAFAISAALLISTAAHLGAEDWPQWRGPNRDDVSLEKDLLQSWPDRGPTSVWTNENSGLGYAGFSIVGDRLYTMGLEQSSDSPKSFVLCLNSGDGTEVWRTEIDDQFSNDWGDGPRSTPTYSDGKLFTLSASGKVVCLDADSGELVWKQSLVDDFGGKVPYWGYSESVLVHDGKVLCTPGGAQGAIVALNKSNGEKVWQSEDFTEAAHYSSIIHANVNGKSQYIQLTQTKLVGLSDQGKVIWTADWPRGRIAVIPTPIFHDGKVYVSSGYNAGSMLVDISGGGAEQVWDNRIMKNHHGGVIRIGQHLYGYSDGRGWTCQNWETGEPVWQDKSLGKGAVGYADGRLYCIDEKTGRVVLAEASPDGWKSCGEFRLNPLSGNRKPQGGIWVHPTIANGKLYLRDQERIYCFDISSP